MKKLLHSLLISSTFVIVAGMSISAYAAGLDVTVDYSDHSVKISGQANAGYRYVSLQVINPGKELKDMLTADNVLNWSDQGKTSADGSFSFTYRITGETGLYTAIVGVDGDNEAYDATFNYFAPSEVDNTLNEIIRYISQKNTEGIASVIDEKSEMLQIDTTDYDALPEENKKLLCKGITESKVSTMNDFKDLFNDGVAVQKLNILTDKDDFYAEVKNIAGDTYAPVNKIFDGMDDETKAAVLKSMMDSDYTTKPGMLDDYTDTVLLLKVKNVKLWGEMESFLSETKDVTGIDLTNYNKLSNKSEAMKKMLGVTYTSVDDIKNKFDAVVKECAAEEAKNKNTGGGGGGGSSSGRSSGSGSKAGYGALITDPAVENGGTAPAADIFADIKDAEWAREGILSLYGKNIISGDGNGYFRPNSNVTRAEFLKMVILRYGLTKGSAQTKNFNDVTENDWYYDYVETAYSNNIVSGISETEFDPNGLITRQDMAVMLYRAAVSTGRGFEAGEMAFYDSGDVSDYARNAVASLSAAGIVNGYDNRFDPLAAATRAQAAQILYNSYER